jgi:murein DD-endopeptidase MepM/ murein hydrolase activator NlpD
MRQRVAANFGKSAARLLVAGLLASAASGCSSDVSRFGGLFSRQDSLTTASIPHSVNGNAPIPRADVAQGSVYAQPQQPMTRNQALNQPYPAASGLSTYGNVNTGTTPSGARLAAAPQHIERTELSQPGVPVVRQTARDVALSQPFPTANTLTTAQETASTKSADPVTTGSTPGAWSTINAPAVSLKQGETIASLSKRYGVPEKEIIRANGLPNAAAAQAGQTIIVPVHRGGAPAKTVIAADGSVVTLKPVTGKVPVPTKVPEREKAILPTVATLREKSAVAADGTNVAAGDKAAAPGKGGSYEVAAGDSLSKIARKTGVSVDAIRSANNLGAGTIRIGQKLTIPAGGTKVAAADTTTPDTLTTGTVAPAKPAPYKAPTPQAATPAAAPKQSVAEVQKKADVTDDAPESTGIGKYRWPVRGAVVAGYGANVDGNRNDGINIAVPQGTAVKAAENGVVIYSGNGLKELGNTVLVRHDDGTVTVYGNADALSVTRGQKVTRGQVIATSGMSGSAKRPQLHFEVRKDATPVNPMTFLD